MRKKQKIFFFAAAGACLLLALTLSILTIAEKNSPADAREVMEPFAAGGKNYLLLGVDAVSSSSDVILIAHVDEEGKGMRLLQLPRDTYTADHGKLNSLYAAAAVQAKKEGKSASDASEAGARALSDFLSEAFGLSLDGYAVITLDDFRRIVDNVGGVEVTLPADLDYDDPAQDLHIHLKAGTHLLSGKDAEGLVRCRSAYLTADYGRMDAQKIFMTAFLKKLKTDLSFGQLFSLVTTTYRHVKTDITLKEALSIGKKMLSASLEDFSFASLKGKSLKINAALYEVIPEKTLEDAAFWLGSEEPSLTPAFCGERTDVSQLFFSEPLYAFAPVTADSIDREGITIR